MRDELYKRLDEIAALLSELPPGDPRVVQALAEVTRLLSPQLMDRTLLGSEQVAVQYELFASRLPPGHPLLPVMAFLGRAARYVQALLARDTERAEAALSAMTGSAGSVPVGHPSLPFIRCGIAAAYVERHSLSGDLRDLERAEAAIDEALADAARVGGAFAPGTELHGFLLHTRGHLRIVWSVLDPTLPRVTAGIEDLERALAQVSPDMAARVDLTSVLDTGRMLREQLTTPSRPGRPLGAVTDAALGRLAAAAERMGRDRIEYPVLAAQAAAGLALRGLSAGQLKYVDQAVALLAGTCAIPGLGLRERPRLLQLHGFALHTRYQMTRDPADLSNAIALLEDARRAVEQELASPYASGVLLSLAGAYRERSNAALGDLDRAERFGLAGLREHAGDVLLQGSDENALYVARRGSDDATEMARWFLGRARPAAAVDAIELGRGMVLHAATSGGNVARALDAAGHPDLAAAWAAQSPAPGPPASVDGGPGDDLRYRAMRALEGSQAEGALLAPPPLDDITAALASSGADALAYLLPQVEGGAGLDSGMAVIIGRDGGIRWIGMPLLRAGAGTAVGEFLRARRAWEQAGDADELSARAKWRAALDAVCDWAWDAAAGRLLRAVGAASRAPGSAGPPRVVLVPGGELGLVPWHAARRELDGSPRFACQDAIFCYAPSARQFVEASRRRPRPWPQAPVLIGDGDQSLDGAAAEIGYLYRAHYDRGKVFGAGVPGARMARPGDVLAALPRGRSPGASLLHFGCHGRVTVPVLEASLRLGADDADREVAVSLRDILGQARAARASGEAADGGLVVLAACLTDVTEADYDEALTLATAFLAAGGSGVVAARWAVPDAATAVFMAVFHQFLNAGAPDPAAALRGAQLWMLDPGRGVPGDWPDVLADSAAMLAGTLAEAESWAAFTYQGR